MKEIKKIGNQEIAGIENDEFLMEMERNAQKAIKEELLRQRDFLSKKLQTVTRLNKQNEEDRDSVIHKVQDENTILIRLCNEQREEKKKLKEHVKIVIIIIQMGNM